MRTRPHGRAVADAFRRPAMRHPTIRLMIAVIASLVVAACLAAPVSAVVLINEVDSDTSGFDTREFIELYDGGAGHTDLSGLVVVLFNGSSDTAYAVYDLDGLQTNAAGYFVLGSALVSSASIIIADNVIQNGADAVALYHGNADTFSVGTAVTTVDLVDALVYDTDDPLDHELLVLLNADQPQVNENGSANKDAHSMQRCPNGAGGLRNTSRYVQAPPTPGAANDCPTIATSVLINEIDADTPGEDAQEFVELYDGGEGHTDLTGLVLVFYNGATNTAYRVFDLDGRTTNADGFFVVGNPDVVPAPALVFAPGELQNGADAVALYVGNAGDFPPDAPLTTANLLDAVVYDTDDADDAELLALLAPGQPQVNEAGGKAVEQQSIQRCPDGAGGQRHTSAFHPALPTPGRANLCVQCNQPRQDLDDDGDVDLSDFTGFLTCFNGPNRLWPGPPVDVEACTCIDVDADLDVDLLDFSAFLQCFNGPARPPACS